MYLIVKGEPQFNITSLSDIGRLVPIGMEGSALNYGQGEGQFSVSGTVWGIYVNDRGQYQIQFEEGQETWPVIQKLVDAVIAQVRSEFGEHLSFKIEGVLKKERA